MARISASRRPAAGPWPACTGSRACRPPGGTGPNRRYRKSRSAPGHRRGCGHRRPATGRCCRRAALDWRNSSITSSLPKSPQCNASGPEAAFPSDDESPQPPSSDRTNNAGRTAGFIGESFADERKTGLYHLPGSGKNRFGVRCHATAGGPVRQFAECQASHPAFIALQPRHDAGCGTPRMPAGSPHAPDGAQRKAETG